MIEAISKVTNEGVSTLADRVLIGTSPHPAKQIGNLSESEKVQTALQRIVDKIDDEFGLYRDTCSRPSRTDSAARHRGSTSTRSLRLISNTSMICECWIRFASSNGNKSEHLD